MELNTQEDLVHRYLLGDLPEEQQLELERDYFAKPETFERVWQIENELVDQYVRNRLSQDERRLFEQNYMSSPVHRERVKFAKALLETVDVAEGVQSSRREVPQVSRWTAFLATLKMTSWQWATIAAVLLLAGISIVLFRERARLHREVDQLRNETASQQQRSQELEKEMAVQRDQNDRLTDELARLREATREVESSPQATPSGSVLSLLLSPMLMRAEGDAQQLKLTKDTPAVILQMKVQQPEDRVYKVDLSTVDGVKIWSRSSIRAQKSKNNRSTVTVTVPASKLAAGEYILSLSAIDGTNQPEEINRYFFKINRE